MRHLIDEEVLRTLPEAGWNIVVMPDDYADLIALGVTTPQGPAIMRLSVGEARDIADTLEQAISHLRPVGSLERARAVADQIALLALQLDPGERERCYQLVRIALERLLLTLPR